MTAHALREALMHRATTLSGCVGAAWTDREAGQRVVTWRPGLPSPDATGSPTRPLAATILQAADALFDCGTRAETTPSGIEHVVLATGGHVLVAARDPRATHQLIAFLCDRSANVGTAISHAFGSLSVLAHQGSDTEM